MKIITTAIPLEAMNKERNFSVENADRLDSWKEIACYLNRNVRNRAAMGSFRVHARSSTSSCEIGIGSCF
jgi:hypothetical protein